MRAVAQFAALIVALAISTAAPRPAPADAPQAVDAKIVLAVDVSGSVDATELGVERGGYILALRHPDLVRAIGTGVRGRIALSYFEWSGQVRQVSVVPWRVIDGPRAAAAFADAITALPVVPGHGTSISRAIDFAVALLEDEAIAGARRIIDVSGDGPNNLGPPVLDARDRAVARGVTVNGLPILIHPSRMVSDLERYYESCVIGGEGSFLLAARTREELAPAIRRKLVLEISGAAPSRMQLAGLDAPVDCLIGERLRRALVDRYFPDLYD